MPDDAQLVSHCQQGDLRAFADLVEQYQDRLFDLAWVILREREAAQDAVQDTFLTAFEKIEGFRGEATLETWLIAITVNKCRSQLRRQKVRRLFSLDNLSPQHRVGTAKQATDPAAIVGQQLQRQALWQLVDHLDDRLRLPILLYYRYGLSGDEVAAALGLATSTVYERLSQGRKRLRQLVTAGLPSFPGGELC
ncbi:MAG TPA: RNA polymerase sigma factor [Chloroflexota bacterium]|nr:RNA polymerase sigma factor [Chloroflexota bacterium]